jgi:hypothetical protein
MARVACRWPGGINLHIKKTGVPPERWPQHRLNGPAGSLYAGVSGDPLRSPKAAQQLRQNHLDRLKEMELTKDKPLHEMEHTVHYVENHVPDHFWNAWVAQQEYFIRHVSPHAGGLHRHRVVFEMEPEPEPVSAPPSMSVSRPRNGRPSEMA